jgi:hypothetical protein
MVLEAGRLGSLCSAAIHNWRTQTVRPCSGCPPPGHAYTITSVAAQEVAVRNPWCNSIEWKEQTSAPDGEFLMPWKDFFSHFHQVGNRRIQVL